MYKASKQSRSYHSNNTPSKNSIPENISDTLAIVLFEWSQRSQAHGLQITETLLENAAENIAPLLGIQKRRPQEGWVKSIMTKYDFSFGCSQHKASAESSNSLKYTDIMDELGIKYNVPSGMEYYNYSVPPVLKLFSSCPENTNNLEISLKNDIKEESSESEPIIMDGNEEKQESASTFLQDEIPSCGFKEVNSYREALNVLGPLERFVLLKGNVRAVGLINQLENLFRGELERMLQAGRLD